MRLDFEGPRGEPFAGTIEQIDAGPLRISRVRATPHGVRRCSEHLHAAVADVLFVNVQVAGSGLTAQHGRERRTGPLDLAVADTLAPFRIVNCSAFELVCAAVPREQAPPPLSGAGGLALSRTAKGREFARLLLGHVALALDPTSGEAAVSLAGRHFLDLLALAAQEITEAVAPKRPEVSAERIRDYVAQSFRDPNLSSARAAAVFGVTERHVQKLLAREGATFSELLAAARLEAAGRALAGAFEDRRSIAEIAFGCGYSDLSHFHRTFKPAFSKRSPRRPRRERQAAGTNGNAGPRGGEDLG